MVICNACLIEFGDLEAFKTHYKTELHRHNLKRKAANLAPITQENFQERQIESKAPSVAPKLEIVCETCNKTFSSQSQLNNHYQSQRHKENIRRNDGKSLERKQEHDQIICAPEVRCLFCSQVNVDLQENLVHMSIKHSFFICDISEVRDLVPLIKYLLSKICVGKTCIYCNFQGSSVQSVQQHMRDKGHCSMGESAEYVQFYKDVDEKEPDVSDWVDLGQDSSEVSSIVSSSVGTIILFGNTDVGQLQHTGELKVPQKLIGHRDYRKVYKQKYKKPELEFQIAVKNNMAVLYSQLGLKYKSTYNPSTKINFEGIKEQQEEEFDIKFKNNKLIQVKNICL